jgi:hypothetical protein
MSKYKVEILKLYHPICVQDNLEKLKFAVSITIIIRAADTLRDIPGRFDAGLILLSNIVQPVEEVVDNVNLAAGLVKEIWDLDFHADKCKTVCFYPSGWPSADTNASTEPASAETSCSSSITAISTFDKVKKIVKEEHDQQVTLAKRLRPTVQVTPGAQWLVCCGH